MKTKVLLTSHMKRCLPYVQSDWIWVDVLCTQNKLCTLMVNDFIIFCCEIPFDDVSDITSEKLLNDWFILIQSQNNGCCVISLLQKKVLDYWKYGKEIFIDDYVNVGHDQLIVVFPDGMEEDFYCTDYKCCFYDTRKPGQRNTKEEILSEEVMPVESNMFKINRNSEGYCSAVKALRTKKFSLITSVNNKKAEVREKQDLLKSCWQSVVSATLGLEYDCTGTGYLIDLFSNGEKGNSVRDSDVKKIFKVHEIWKKVSFDQLVIGVEVENVSEGSLYELCLSFVVNGRNCSSITSTRYISTDVCSKNIPKIPKFDDSVNDCFLPNQKEVLTLVTQKPDFRLSSSVVYNLKIDFKRNSEKYSVCIGPTVITTADIVSCGLTIAPEFISRDEISNFAFECASIKFDFLLNSKITSIKHLAHSLSKRMKSQLNIVNNISVLSPRCCIGSEIRLSHDQEQCNCTIFAKNEEDIFLILSELESMLPADVELKINTSSNNLLIKLSCNALKNELSCYVDLVEKYLVKAKEEEFEKNVVIIDAPKRKKEEDFSETEEMLKNLVKTTDQCFANLAMNISSC